MSELSRQELQRLEKEITDYCSSNRIFGVLRLTKNDHIISELSFGYADLSSKKPFTSDSRFSLYSLSKPFCAIGIMLLYEKGLVDLDRHPSEYLPEASDLDKRLTIRHLLHHISGLPDFEQCKPLADAKATGEPDKIREQLKILACEKLHFPPASAVEYANINMIIPALIMENLSGLPYAEYLRREVLLPLGMTSTEVDRRGLILPNCVQGYKLDESGAVVPTVKSYDWMLGAGDLVGTIEDVYALNRAIKHELLLSHESWQMILTVSPNGRFGMGCTVYEQYGRKIIKHNGGHSGFRTLHLQIPADDLDLIFLSNSGYGKAREAIIDLVLSTFYGESKSTDTDIPAMDKGYIPEC